MTYNQLTQQIKWIEHILAGMRKRAAILDTRIKSSRKSRWDDTFGVISKERGEEMLREIEAYRKAPARGPVPE